MTLWTIFRWIQYFSSHTRIYRKYLPLYYTILRRSGDLKFQKPKSCLQSLSCTKQCSRNLSLREENKRQRAWSGATAERKTASTGKKAPAAADSGRASRCCEQLGQRGVYLRAPAELVAAPWLLPWHELQHMWSEVGRVFTGSSLFSAGLWWLHVCRPEATCMN